MKGYGRHRFFFKFLGFFARPFLRLKFNFRPVPAQAPDGPFILVANHCTDYDPFLTSLSFKRHMYFLASEHIFRWGFLSKVIVWLFDPIAKQKGNTDLTAVRDCLARLKAGAPVGIFAEGNSSFDGITAPIAPATAKLIKIAGTPLVTYRLTGGYLSSPRWGKRTRRGRMTGQVTGVWPAEQLREMSVTQINELISAGIREDAYARQTDDPVPYRGRKRAQYVERVLFTCPVCGATGTLSSSGNELSCACGARATLGEDGFFAGDFAYDNIRDWNAWQQRALFEAAAKDENLTLADDGASLYSLDGTHRAHRNDLVGQGRLTLDARALCCAGKVFELKHIQSLAVVNASNIVFTDADGGYFEIRFDGAQNAYKYYLFFNHIKERTPQP